MKRVCFFAVILSFFYQTTALMANPVSELDYQGKVLLNDLPFTGSGFFKFSVANQAGTTNYWANDGTGTGEPAANVTNIVFNGVFSTILGASPMTAINPAIFNNGSNLYLRVWFGTVNTNFSEMLPSQKIVSSAYAINAGLLGGSSASLIQSNAVSLATNAITLAGDVTGLPQANQIAAGVIVDADVNASADIKGSKIQMGSTTNKGVVQIAVGSTGTAVIAAGHPYLNAFSTVNSIVAGTPNSGFGIVGSNNVIVTVSGTNVVINSPFVPALDNVIWVATNGTSAGPGTIERPYHTPQSGYDAATAAYPGVASAVLIAAGSYSTNGLIMSAGSVHVMGLYRPELASLDVVAAATGLAGFQNIEGIVITGPASVSPPGGSFVRFHNCRMNSGLVMEGSDLVVQDCRITVPGGTGPALAIGTFVGAASVGVYQSSIENRDSVAGAIEIGYPGLAGPNVQGVEVIGCEIVNTEGATGPAIQDWTPFHGPGFPINLFSHNYIKGPFPAAGPGYGPPAIADPAAPPGPAGWPPGTIPFLGIYNNTIFGHVGSVTGPGAPHEQWYGNNMLYGIITYPGFPSAAGWVQAGGGTGIDPVSGDVQHEIPGPYGLPFPPDLWND